MTTSHAAATHDYDDIKVRRMDFAFSEATPTFWADGNPFLTSLLAGVSVSFPPGERFFISSVKHFLPQVKDPELRKAVRAFIGQEGNHTKEHLAFNAFLDGCGFPASKVERFIGDRIAEMRDSSTPEQNLARTAGLEHLTAVLASALLETPEALERMSPEAATLWAWHAIEEIEHRSVAFDVYKLTVDDEDLRKRTMTVALFFFALSNGIRLGLFMRAVGKQYDVLSIVRGLYFLFGKPGMLRNVPARIREYYRPDFHPSQHDASAEVAYARRKYLGEQPA